MRDLYQSPVIISMERANPLAQHRLTRLLRLNILLLGDRRLLDRRLHRIILRCSARQIAHRRLTDCNNLRVKPRIDRRGRRGRTNGRVKLWDRRERRLGKERNRRLRLAPQPIFLGHGGQKRLGTLDHILNNLVRNSAISGRTHLEDVVQLTVRELRFREASQPLLGRDAPRGRREKNGRGAAVMGFEDRLLFPAQFFQKCS
ncbi:hypothetical protein ACM7LV_27035 [Pseudomonas aeruginosa]|uniref:Uncharacterized protein n=1 Tax=Pseudomonas aeruginosa TaxID=287 RepID=A0A9P1R9Y1_PSEAI|nr:MULTISPECIES: hypothetical protein [Pseudomonas]KFF32771.1 hypothetical protein G039_0328035 [Pseudomonas aeruginosa VRFPA01]SCZ07033.1 Uncharacterised protein [Acinetobacter baumannii]EKV3606886.1 hypothetical protein [Pseudomonas aeruginosa]EKW6796071.1 hypothetical protein [Pseudomonas aeruginosa]EKX7258135.1 hypothetical protein [Pseudomonas aeruginosa]